MPGNETNYEVFREPGAAPIKAWTRGVPIEDVARQQLANVARLPFVHRWIAVMPDVHWGIGATVGCVIPTFGAVIPAAVGVDIGCGMIAAPTSLSANDLPDQLAGVRSAIESAVPHGRTHQGGRNDRGAWGHIPSQAATRWRQLEPGLERIARKHPKCALANHARHLGTLGSGNHFIEVCLDEADRVWIMLHSGSRGIGNRIGTYFIALAKRDMKQQLGELPDRDLAYFREGSNHFDEYVEAGFRCLANFSLVT